ncbi:MAG: hypothetical protein AAFQ82_27210, partial [Myxococcota bacterium]
MRPALVSGRPDLFFASSKYAPVAHARRSVAPRSHAQDALDAQLTCRLPAPGGDVILTPALERAAQDALDSLPKLSPLRAGVRQALNTGFYFVSSTYAGALSLARGALQRLSPPPWKSYVAPKQRVLPDGFPPAQRARPPRDVPAILKPMAFSEPFDIHYDGQFCIPGHTDAAVDFDAVMARDDWPDFIKQHLTVGESSDCEPLRVFFPGLQTPLEKSQTQLEYYHGVLGLPMAQIANGTTMDMGPLELKLPGRKEPIVLDGSIREVVQATVKRFEISPARLVDILVNTLGAQRKGKDHWELKVAGGTLVRLNLRDLEQLANQLRHLE